LAVPQQRYPPRRAGARRDGAVRDVGDRGRDSTGSVGEQPGRAVLVVVEVLHRAFLVDLLERAALVGVQVEG
jgi:hypothetical protein